MARLGIMGSPLAWCFFLALGLLLQPAEGAGGACSSSAVTISVTTVADLDDRKSYPVTQTCNLVLQNDLTVTSSIFLDASFACTVLKSASGQQFKVSASSSTFPALLVRGTNNVLIQNIDWSVPTSASSSPCPSALVPDTSTSLRCPAVHIHTSWGVQLVQGAVTGRIDVIKSPQTSLDSLAITSYQAETALVTVSKSGNGPGLVRNKVSISNCVLEGGQIGVMLNLQAVGTTISNNRFHNQFFTGVQCGQGVHNVGDCMLSSYLHNLFTMDSTFTPSSDASGVYFGTHWVNHGNYLSCNYVIGGKQCLYLDYASSGVTVDGMVCYNLNSGMKLNTGHSNNVSSFLSILQRQPAWISCQNYNVNNCNQEVGQFWDNGRITNYNSATFQQTYPWLNNFCSLTSFQGVNCNPAGSANAASTGKCSGVPTGNKASVVIVDSLNVRNTPTYLSCQNVSAAPSLNSMDWITLTSAQALFTDPANQDFGVQAGSPIYDTYPQFRSCPRSAVGPKAVSASTYTNNFNVLQTVPI